MTMSDHNRSTNQVTATQPFWMQGLLPIFFSRTITMSSNKRRFDFLGVSSFGDSSRKRAKTPASEVAEDILYFEPLDPTRARTYSTFSI
jgi:hypothetical protein